MAESNRDRLIRTDRALCDALDREEALIGALMHIVAQENSRHTCVMHGGDVGADDPEGCWCGVSLDRAEKMEAIAKRALAEGAVARFGFMEADGPETAEDLRPPL